MSDVKWDGDETREELIELLRISHNTVEELKRALRKYREKALKPASYFKKSVEALEQIQSFVWMAGSVVTAEEAIDLIDDLLYTTLPIT